MNHRTSLIQNTFDTYAAVCEDCAGWMGGDGNKGEAELDAAMYQRANGIRGIRAVIVEWTPEKRM